jgi:RNA polymerase sigma factor (sigma-70 family)
MAAIPLFLDSDARILDGIRRGDEKALAELYRDQRKPIFSLVLKNQGGPDDAEDVLQEALVILWERVRTGRHTYDARLGTFMYATARNIWLRRLARARREVSDPDATGEATSGDPDALEEMMEEEETGFVKQGLEQIGTQCKELLLMYYWEELSMAEIALRMGLANADTAKAKKYQCKKALEAVLRELRKDE